MSGQQASESIMVLFGDGSAVPAANVKVTNFNDPSPCGGAISGSAGNAPMALPFSLGDFSGDGGADIYMSSYSTVLVSNGRSFAAPQPVRVTSGGFRPNTDGSNLGPPVADFNGDGNSDVATGDVGWTIVMFNPSGWYSW
jgi:hypothetical protein